ncbi:MAG: hypothetical protein RJA61_33 [Candidatus Parcubacteria bacterium]|jgi:excinuclease ABC subunit C
MSNIQEQVKNLPDSSGVYLFKNEKGDILYIGKATSLHDRVRSYFSNDIEFVRSPLIAKMITDASKIDIEKTDSVLEALILEAHLIKKHQPPYNTKEKDNKSFNYVVITKEDFPQVLVVRGRDLDSQLKAKTLKIKASFGPFPHGKELQEALKIVRKLFPFHDARSKKTYGEEFYKQLGLAPDVSREGAEKEYTKIIKNIILFFEGNKKKIIKNLEREMQIYAKNLAFEKAEGVKRKIFALNHIQDVALIKERQSVIGESFRIEAYDVAHIAGTSVVGVMTVIEDREIKRSDYRKFIIKDNPGVNDTGALREILTRRFNHLEWAMPTLVVVDGGIAQKNTAESFLKEKNIQIPVVAVTKDGRHKPREIQGDVELVKTYEKNILLANGEAHRFALKFHRQKRDQL